MIVFVILGYLCCDMIVNIALPSFFHNVLGISTGVLLNFNKIFNYKVTYAIYISMAKCKTALTPLLTHWSYCSLALSHRYAWFNLHEEKMLLSHCWNAMNVHSKCILVLPRFLRLQLKLMRGSNKMAPGFVIPIMFTFTRDVISVGFKLRITCLPLE